MAEQERNAIRILAFLVDKVDLERVLMPINGNRGGELRELVQFRFRSSPVILLLPIVHKPTEVIKWRAVLPVIGKSCLARKCREGELLLKPLDGRIRDSDLVGFDGGAHEGRWGSAIPFKL